MKSVGAVLHVAWTTLVIVLFGLVLPMCKLVILCFSIFLFFSFKALFNRLRGSNLHSAFHDTNQSVLFLYVSSKWMM